MGYDFYVLSYYYIRSVQYPFSGTSHFVQSARIYFLKRLVCRVQPQSRAKGILSFKEKGVLVNSDTNQNSTGRIILELHFSLQWTVPSRAICEWSFRKFYSYSSLQLFFFELYFQNVFKHRQRRFIVLVPGFNNNCRNHGRLKKLALVTPYIINFLPKKVQEFSRKKKRDRQTDKSFKNSFLS